MDPALVELFNAADEGEEVEVIARLRRANELPPGLRPVSRFGEVVTGRVVREQLRPVWAHERVVSLKAPRTYRWDDTYDLETSSDVEPWPGDGLCRRTDLASGRGIVVGVCDWGLDVKHADFRNADGSTRILALWDQSSGEGEAPEPFGYGRVMYRAEIDAALRSSDPYEALGYRAGHMVDGTHGTHVTGIAAGNGRAPGSIRSAAYEADIVFVHLHAARTPGLGNLGDSVRLLEAIDFVRCTAGTRSWVCNCSLGRTGGPHDGSTLVEKGIDAVLQHPGCAVVMSSGNYHSHRSAASGVLRAGHTTVLGWRISPSDRTQNEIEIWYSARDDLVVRLRAPDGSVAAKASLADRTRVMLGGSERGRLYHRACDPNNGDHQINVFLDPGSPSGEWKVELEPVSVQDGRYYAWIERDPGPPGTQSTFAPEVVSTECTTGTICNGAYSITVGGVDAHRSGLPLGRFSSGGRLRDGRFKPDLVAPGVQVLAACSASGEAGDLASPQTRKSGTSMAAPHVTGAIAAMMQAAARPLPIEEIRRILRETAGFIDRPRDARRLGAGLLNLDRAITRARDGVSPPLAAAPARVQRAPIEAVSEMRNSENCGDTAPVWLPLSGSVGLGGQNEALDLSLIQQRLVDLGLLRARDAASDRDAVLRRGLGRPVFTDAALASFQTRLHLERESVVVPGSATHRLLMRPDLPAPRALNLTLPVGDGHPYAASDERRVRARLCQLGFADVSTPLSSAIALFQERLLAEVTGRVLPGSLDERVLGDPTFGTLTTFPRFVRVGSGKPGASLQTLMQQATSRRTRGECLCGMAPQAGVPMAFGHQRLNGPTALGGLARLRGRVEATLSPEAVQKLASRAAGIGALFDTLGRVHLPSDARMPLREAARSLLGAFDASVQEQTGLFPADLLRMLRAQRQAGASGDALASARLRSERSAFQTKGLLTSLQGQALRDAMSGSLSDVLLGERSAPALSTGECGASGARD